LLRGWVATKKVDDGTAAAAALMVRYLGPNDNIFGLPPQQVFLNTLRIAMARPFITPPPRPAIPPLLTLHVEDDEPTYFSDFIDVKTAWLTNIFLTLYDTPVVAPMYVDIAHVYWKIGVLAEGCMHGVDMGTRRYLFLDSNAFVQGSLHKLLRRMSYLRLIGDGRWHSVYVELSRGYVYDVMDILGYVAVDRVVAVILDFHEYVTDMMSILSEWLHTSRTGFRFDGPPGVNAYDDGKHDVNEPWDSSGKHRMTASHLIRAVELLHSAILIFKLLTQRSSIIRDMMMTRDMPPLAYLFNRERIGIFQGLVHNEMSTMYADASLTWTTRGMASHRGKPLSGQLLAVMIQRSRDEMEWSWSYPIVCMALRLATHCVSREREPRGPIEFDGYTEYAERERSPPSDSDFL
jgi:hypothetical protein